MQLTSFLGRENRTGGCPQNKRTRSIVFPWPLSMRETTQQKPILKIEQQRNKATKVETEHSKRISEQFDVLVASLKGAL
jgi:hypothetical protein